MGVVHWLLGPHNTLLCFGKKKKNEETQPIFEGHIWETLAVECEVVMLASISSAKIVWFY